MSLGQKQRKFALMLAQLICYAYSLGYELSFGRGSVSKAANEADGGHKRSLHLLRLAQDLNLFKDASFLTDGAEHSVLHDYWDMLGGAKRIAKDMNHYSLEHDGMK